MITALELAIQSVRQATDIPVSSQVPRVRPDLFCRVDQGTPRRLNPITEENIIFIQVYGGDLEEVLAHIGAIRDYFTDLDAFDLRVQGWEETEGPHEWPDPDLSGVYRWQLAGTLSFTHT